ncbi:MAG: HAMP domain-containing sensor histidine kinase, partial [Myxococcota bacterium]
AVKDHAEDGLRYLAVVQGGWFLAQGGTPLESPDTIMRSLDSAGKRMMVVVGDRIRLVQRPPKPGAGKRRLHKPMWQPRKLRPELPIFVIEFVPSEAHQLRAASLRTLGIGASAAGVLLILALALVRWFVRQDALAREREQERRLASLGQMSAVLAHELRNPLTSLKGNAQILARLVPRGEPARAKATQKAERVVAEAIRLETLTNDLLEFARSGAIQRSVSYRAALLRQAVADVLAAQPEKRPEGAGAEPAEPAEPGDPADSDAVAGAAPEITVDTSAAPATWSLDGRRMGQVLSNLLHNAVQASNRVAAAVATEGDQLVFTVRDHGDGIGADALPHLFEPFYTQRTRGTGLGLAVAKRLVELHGGTISATNGVDGGAEFRVVVPPARR